jgi:hypothetical protein
LATEIALARAREWLQSRQRRTGVLDALSGMLWMRPDLELLAIDESILDRLLAAGIAFARPQEVMPPVRRLDQ